MAENQKYPVIIIPGIGQSNVIETDSAGQPVKRLWPLDLDKDLLLDRLKAPFMKMMFFRRDGGFTDAVAQTVSEMLGGLRPLPTGETRPGVRAETYPYPLSECSAAERRHILRMAPVDKLFSVLGEENVFFFAYNSFALPYTVAEELDAFVQMVKRRTGSEKISFMPLSLGGAMFTAYLDRYGAASVHRVVYFVPALQGTVSLGDLFNKRIDYGKMDSLLGLLLGENAAANLGRLTGMMPEGVPRTMAEKLIDTLLCDMLVNSGAMWACLPPEEYAPLAQKYLADEAHAALRAQTDRYRAAQGKLRETLLEMQRSGVGIYIIACYGRSALAALESAGKVSTDGLIDLKSASLGATAPPPGAADEGAVDAAAGAFPESTWYFYDQYHDSIAYNDAALEIAQRALSEESFVSIHSVPALGQFQKKQDNRNG